MNTSLFKEALAVGEGIGDTSVRQWVRVRRGDGKTSLQGGRTRSSLGGPTTIAQWFNTQAFSAPAAGYFGNEGTGSLAGLGLINFDMALTRSFAVTKKHKIEFRAEFFDIFNQINFTSVATTCGSGNFGQVTVPADPCIVALVLRYQFSTRYGRRFRPPGGDD